MATTDSAPTTRAPELRSVADSIAGVFPDAADLLRGIAREMEEST